MEKLKILVIEDSKLIRERLTLALSSLKENVELYLTTKMSEALICLNTKYPRVIILDLFLPDGNGIKLLEKVKKESAKTVVIVLTNFPYPQVKNKCKKLGADYFYSKENDFDKVINTVESLVLFQKAAISNNNI